MKAVCCCLVRDNLLAFRNLRIFLLLQMRVLIASKFSNQDEDKMKRTYQPHCKSRARTHGFRARSRTPGGRNVLRARRAKGRKRISIQAYKK